MRLLFCVSLVLVACTSPDSAPQDPVGPVETTAETSGEGGATYRGRKLTLTDPQAQDLAEGVNWSNTITAVTNGSSVKFTWSVERTGGDNVPDASWTGTTSVPNGTTTTLTFPLDMDGAVEHYILTLGG